MLEVIRRIRISFFRFDIFICICHAYSYNPLNSFINVVIGIDDTIKKKLWKLHIATGPLYAILRLN